MKEQDKQAACQRAKAFGIPKDQFDKMVVFAKARKESDGTVDDLIKLCIDPNHKA